MTVRSSRGFTVREIMASVFIVGLLAAVIGPKVASHHSSEQRGRAAEDIQHLAESLHRFHADNGYYPSTGEGLEILVNPNGKAPHANPEGYIERIPTDPWGKPYAYLSDRKRFLLKSLGADGRDGGEGNAADITFDDAQI